MKIFAALSLSAALVGATAVTLPVSSAQAAPIGVLNGISDAGKPVVDQVQYRPGYRRGGGRYYGRRGGNGAGVAAGLIGAAIVGGAIIAESQRRDRAAERAYYYGNGGYGYYDDGYYAQPTYVAPRRRYYDPENAYGPRNYGYPPAQYHHHNRTVRDPAGGGQMRVGGP